MLPHRNTSRAGSTAPLHGEDHTWRLLFLTCRLSSLHRASVRPRTSRDPPATWHRGRVGSSRLIFMKTSSYNPHVAAGRYPKTLNWSSDALGGGSIVIWTFFLLLVYFNKCGEEIKLEKHKLFYILNWTCIKMGTLQDKGILAEEEGKKGREMWKWKAAVMVFTFPDLAQWKGAGWAIVWRQDP